MTKVYKIELMIIDHDGLGPEEVQTVLEEQHYPNRCIAPQVVSLQSAEVEWDDDHPLNKTKTWEEAFNKLFSK